MINPLRLIAALGCLAAVALASPCVQAQEKHDSNTLHKLGKAIQYPVKKAGENASIAAHRATGRKSVVHRRNGSRTYRAVVTPKGHIYRKHLVSSAHPVRTHHRRHHRTHRKM